MTSIVLSPLLSPLLPSMSVRFRTSNQLDWHWGEQWTWQRTEDNGGHSFIPPSPPNGWCRELMMIKGSQI